MSRMDAGVAVASSDEPRKHSEHRVDTTGQVGQRDPDPRRRSVGIAGVVQVPGVRLHNQVEGRPVPRRSGLTEAGDGCGHDCRIAQGHGVVVDSEAGEHARPKVVDHRVGGFDQLQEGFPAALVAKIHGHALLVAVHEQVDRALVAQRGDSWIAVGVTGNGLDLDDRRPEIGQDRAAERSGDHLTQFQDGDSLQQPVHRSACARARSRTPRDSLATATSTIRPSTLIDADPAETAASNSRTIRSW